MEIGDTLYVTERGRWREWLEANFGSATEIWLLYPNKATGKPRIPYNDAVEEALCFGWIDSIIKKASESIAAQRFTPRNLKSGYSQPNKERLRWLDERGMIHPTVQEAARRALAEPFVFPDDVVDAIRADADAWRNYNAFSESYRRIRVAYVDAARIRPEEFDRRLASLIRATAKGRKLGTVGMEKYY